MFSIYMKKFKNSIIFYISCCDKNITQIFINSTTNYEVFLFKFVKDYHKGSQNRTIYQVIRDHGGLLNWEWEILERFTDCKSKMELEEHEFLWWNKLIEPIQPPLTYKQILQEVDTVQALRIQNELYVSNFNQLVKQIDIYGIIMNPQPEKKIL